MKRMKLLRNTLLAGALLLSAQASHAQHINAGANSQNQNDQLVWENGAEFAASSGYAKELTLATSGRYAGLYNGSLTFTALPSATGGAALGSFLTAEIVSVAGPVGATFAFWEGADQGGGATPLYSIATGSSGLSHQFALSDATAGAGTVGGDAYGHLHGRRFTTTDLGIYTVGIRAIDTSVNGVSGGPIHTASEVLYVNFAAVPEPSTFALAGLGLAGFWILRRKRNG